MKTTLPFYFRGIIGLFFFFLVQLESEARFSVYSKADSSSFKQFKGTILDSKTRNELIFASITVSGTSISTISNSEGKFSIKIPNEKQHLSLIVSFLGYKNKVVPIGDLKPEKNMLYLEPSDTILEEVVVKMTDAKQIFLGVLKNRSQNFIEKPFENDGPTFPFLNPSLVFKSKPFHPICKMKSIFSRGEKMRITRN
jgi:hypothetical protein